MNAEFNWWLLVVGLVLGAGLAWLVLADLRRHDEDLSEAEVTAEAAWIADELRGSSTSPDAATAEAVLRLHRSYLARSLPPDEETLEDRTETPSGPIAGQPPTASS